ncbi:putative oxidoreductase C26F1.07 [Grifola frondosa]|uniref:Putative oxidoreductase C26F1.07 n=1 Tax=Grifola frondosa TaxID=5627 RepID=A0A1C7M5D7_GRIFR|nr:putative oxidoreductase C26F1.07 [Grifola frondosa]
MKSPRHELELRSDGGANYQQLPRDIHTARTCVHINLHDIGNYTHYRISFAMLPRFYKPIPQDEGIALDERARARHRDTKDLLLHFLTVAAVMCATYVGVRFLVRVGSKLRYGVPCHGVHRNLSSLPSHFTLPSGDEIPSVALGVWQADRGEVGAAVKTALKSGYRHIDGAWAYHNEEEVGQALKESGVPRDQVWLTSKLWNAFHAPEDVEAALDDSLRKLDTEYLDLYLIHWPIAFKKDSMVFDEALTADPYPTWQKLEEMVEKGKVRNIGVSNFNIKRLENLTANPLKYQPAVNQVELNYWNPQPELLQWAKEHGMLLEAYSPLGNNKKVKETLALPEVHGIAKNLTVVLPKSVTPSRVMENFQISKLPAELFDKLENAATAHPPQRVVNPSKTWGLDFDIFDDDGPLSEENISG